MAAKTTPIAQPGQPVSQPTNDGALAPWPVIDRYPIVIGPGLSLTYVSSIFRLSLLGYRQQYVDLLDELLEKEPHGFSVLSKRILTVADGRLEITPADTTGNEGEKEMAQKISDQCGRWIAQIPDMHQHIASLGWAMYYAVSGLENHWVRDEEGWHPTRLSFIHSRRLSYPVNGSWDLYIWDQGQVLPSQSYGMSPTNEKIWGLRVADFPGKFIIHAPQIRGNYPTRDGLGRQLAYWFVLKLISTRGGAQYLERFAKPWPEAVYATDDGGKGPRAATKEDIDAATAALSMMGAGSVASWTHPDSVTLNLRTPDDKGTAKLTYKEWLEICNSEISKAVSGGTLTTEVGSTGGNRALGQVQKQGEMALAKYDARCIAETIKRDLVSWMVALNFPGQRHLVPNVNIRVEPDPDPMEIITRAAAAANVGMAVDADKIAEQAGIPVLAPGDMKGRRLVPTKMVDPLAIDPDLAAKAREIAPEAPEESDDTSDAGDSADDETSTDASKSPDTEDDNGDDTADDTSDE